MSETLSARALCSLSDAKNYLAIELTETSYDETLKRLINAASDDIYRATGRDFHGDTETRTYEVWESRLGLNVIAIHDAATVTAAVLKSADGTVLANTFSLVDLLPRSRRSFEPITMIRLREVSNLKDSDYVEVTGNYGWPSVPEPVRQACILTVAGWFARDVRKFSETFVEEAGSVELPRQFPLAVLDTLRTYARPVVR